ncbi:hypothetical protein [Chitinophaga sp. RAB17]|uniref:hypothetical protein n=1 Tax=Chitinophaga sp. RAB17 TaxID=3233049 RepID=UPI003F8E1185
MAINTHINNWIDRADLVMDYYTLFIKAWIPYNAWYMLNFYDESSNPKRDRDGAIINHINATSNRYRDKIKSLLKGMDDSSKEFRWLIGRLHYELEANPIPDFENRISFSTISLNRNNTKTHSQSSGQFIYFVEYKDSLPKTSKRWFLEVQKKRTNQTIHRVELFNWSIVELTNDSDFNAIPDWEKKNQLKEAFQKINPNKPIEIIIPGISKTGKSTQPNNSIVIDGISDLYFTNDYDLVSKIIVQMLYELRCKLFHGELDPIEANSGVYEFAYKIQKTLIKELR